MTVRNSNEEPKLVKTPWNMRTGILITVRSNEEHPSAINADVNIAQAEKPNGKADLEAADHQSIVDTQTEQEEDTYLHGTSLVLMTLSLMVGVLMIALDNSIIGRFRPFDFTSSTNQSKRLLSRRSPVNSIVLVMSVGKYDFNDRFISDTTSM